MNHGRNAIAPRPDGVARQWQSLGSGPELRPIPLAAGDLGDLIAELGWQQFANCTQADPEAFFVERGGDITPARRVCNGCVVRDACLEYALDYEARHPVSAWGVWGGRSPEERRVILRDRGALAPGAGLPDGLRRYREGREAEARQRVAAGRKECSRCGTVKRMDDFSRLSRSLDGRESECKACRSARRRVGEQAA